MADVIARIYLYPKDKGGPRNLLSRGFRCPLKWEFELEQSHFNDCALDLEAGKTYAAGETFTVGVWFLCRELFDDKLRVGTKFELWDTRFIGEGEITQIFSIDDRGTYQ